MHALVSSQQKYEYSKSIDKNVFASSVAELCGFATTSLEPDKAEYEERTECAWNV